MHSFLAHGPRCSLIFCSRSLASLALSLMAALNCVSFYFNCSSIISGAGAAPPNTVYGNDSAFRIKFKLFQQNVITVWSDDDGFCFVTIKLQLSLADNLNDLVDARECARSVGRRRLVNGGANVRQRRARNRCRQAMDRVI